MLGNWSEVRTDNDGDGNHTESGEKDTRTHNEANELLSRAIPGQSGTPLDLTFDDAGNAKTQEVASLHTRLFTHDAWNRLVKAVNNQTSPATNIGAYSYNALSWRIVKRCDTSTASTPNGLDQQRSMWYDASWRMVQEDVDDYTNNGSPNGVNRVFQQVWGARYIDDAVLRRCDRNADGDYIDSTDGHWWHLTDAQFSTLALVDKTGALSERVSYTSYGAGTHRWPHDVNNDGAANSSDSSIISGLSGIAIADSTYNVAADLNRDGVINSSDSSIYTALGAKSALTSGWISDPAGPDNIAGFDGYIFNPEMKVYTVRFRWYEPALGRWMQTDPAGSVDGMNLFQYGRDAATMYVDPSGAVSISPTILFIQAARRADCLAQFDDAERRLVPKLQPSPDSSIAIFDFVAWHAFNNLTNADRQSLGIFHNIQSCILQNIASCSSCKGNLFDQADSDWITDVVRDFMRPYVTSLCERASGFPPSDAGWNNFFWRLDNGLIKSTKFPPVALELEIARQMALNHIQNDLRQALVNNGTGNNAVWSCIGGVVDSCQRNASTGFLQPGADLAGKYWDEYDIQTIRDRMRDSVK